MRGSLATAAAALALAAPAHAATTTVVHPFGTGLAWGVTGVTTNEGGGVADPVRTLVATARAEANGSTVGPWSDIGLQCTAKAPGALSTTSDCFIRGRFTGAIYRFGDREATTGPLDANIGLKLHVSQEPFEACTGATAAYPDGVTVTTPTSCAPN